MHWADWNAYAEALIPEPNFFEIQIAFENVNRYQ
jgi:hypothetical protein